MRYRINNLFLTTSVHFCNKIPKLIPNARNQNFFFGKMIYYFFHTSMKNAFFIISRFFIKKNADFLFFEKMFLMWSTSKSKGILILTKSFLVCSIGHNKKKSAKLFVQTSMKNKFVISSRYLLQKCTDVVKKRKFIL